MAQTIRKWMFSKFKKNKNHKNDTWMPYLPFNEWKKI